MYKRQDITSDTVTTLLSQLSSMYSWNPVSYTHLPIITGQDCDTPNVKNLVAGKQAMSVFKDTRALASAVVKMVDSIMKGEEPEVNDTKSYDNGTGVIPTYLCDPVVVTTDNYRCV